MSDDVEKGISAIQDIADDSKRLSKVTEILTSQIDGLSPLREANLRVKEQLDMVTMLQGKLEQRIADFETRLAQTEKASEKVMEVFFEKVSKELASALDRHLSDIRAELRDTREATRDRFDTNIQQLKQELSDVERRLTAEMPRSIFGKRGT